MNRALRRRHLGLVAVLAVVAAGLLAGAAKVHRSTVTVPALLTPPGTALPSGGIVAETRVLGLALRLLADSGAQVTGIELEPLDPIRVADPLAYWAPAPAGDTLPAAAVLLGALMPGQVLRAPLPSAGGDLLLYSLATRRVVATTHLPAGTGAP